MFPRNRRSDVYVATGDATKLSVTTYTSLLPERAG